MLTVAVTGLIDASDSYVQMDLFSGEEEVTVRKKERKMEETVDKIRKKFGTTSISTGAIIESDIGISAPKDRRNK